MIIYVASGKKTFGGELDTYGNSHFAVDVPRYDDHYLYRQEWREQGQTGIMKLKHEDFIKVVSDQWVNDHHYYYGCEVLKDYDGNWQTGKQSQYENFLGY